MGVDSAFATQLRLQRLYNRIANRQPWPGQASLKQVQSSVKLLAIVSVLFDRSALGAHNFIDRINQALESRQVRWVRDACPTEEHYAAVLVSL